MTGPDWTEFTAQRPFRTPRAREALWNRSLEKIAQYRHIGRRRRRHPANVGFLQQLFATRVPMRRVAYLGVVALSLAASSAAWGQDQEPGMAELPPPSPDLPIFAGQPATHPFEAMSGQAAASRVLFEGAGPDNTQIVIREMLIGHRTGQADFPHPALGQDFTPLLSRATPSAVSEHSMRCRAWRSLTRVPVSEPCGPAIALSNCKSARRSP